MKGIETTKIFYGRFALEYEIKESTQWSDPIGWE